MANQKVQLPENVPPLNTYYMYLTEGCNLACQHCWIAPTFQPNGGTGGHLNYELFMLAIEEGLPLGLRNVKLTGGEPLLHPDLIKMIDFLREKGLGLTIETNGTLLTESLAHYLKEKSTLGLISVSLDGAIAETHDSFRGVKGSFEKTVQSIRYLVEVGFHPQAIMSIHAGNVDEIEKLVRLAENLGAGSVKFNLINPTGRGNKMIKQGRGLSIARLVDLGRWIENDFQKHVSIKLYYSWPVVFHSLQRLSNENPNTCDIDGILGILPSGHLAMCGIGTQIPELCYGQVGKDSISDVWLHHPVINQLRQKFADKLDGLCSNCLFKETCLGHCVAENYSFSGRLTAPFWFCQQADEMKIFPNARRRLEVTSQISCKFS